MLPDHILPDHMLPDHILPDHILPDHILPDHILPDHMVTLCKQIQISGRHFLSLTYIDDESKTHLYML